MRLIIKQNDAIWKVNEREQILQRALEIYLSAKSRKHKLHSATSVSTSNTLSRVESSGEKSMSEDTLSEDSNDDTDDEAPLQEVEITEEDWFAE